MSYDTAVFIFEMAEQLVSDYPLSALETDFIGMHSAVLRLVFEGRTEVRNIDPRLGDLTVFGTFGEWFGEIAKVAEVYRNGVLHLLAEKTPPGWNIKN